MNDDRHFRAEIKNHESNKSFLYVVQDSGARPDALRGGTLILDLKPGAEEAEVRDLASRLGYLLDNIRIHY